MAEVITKFKVETQQYDAKIRKAKADLKGLETTSKGLKNALGDMAGKMGMNLSVLSKFGAAGAAAAGAIKVMSDAFKQNEVMMDDWNRAVEASKGVYQGFLDALNNGDFSGFFNNIRNIISQSKEAYNALDELGTFSGFSSREHAKLQSEYSKAIADYKENPTAENKAIAEKANAAVIAYLEQQQQYVSKAYVEGLEQLASTRGLTGKDAQAFVDMFKNSTYTKLVNTKSDYEENAGWVNGTRHDKFRGRYVESNGRGGFIYLDENGEFAGGMNQAEVSAMKLARALSQVGDDVIAQKQSLGVQEYQISDQIANQRRSFNRLIGNRGTTAAAPAAAGVTSAEATYTAGQIGFWEQQKTALEEQLKDLSLTSQQYQKIAMQLEQINHQLDVMKGKSSDGLQSSLAVGSAAIGAPDMTTMNGVQNNPVAQAGYDAQTAWQAAAQAVSEVGGALNGLENPAGRVLGTIAMAIANVAAGMGAAIAQKGKEMEPWSWIAFSAAATGTMISSIAAIKSATSGYENGGIIGAMPGNPYRGDNVVARLNMGEGVLTKQGIAAAGALLNGGGLQPIAVTGRISGRDILLAVDNDNRARGGSRGMYANIK